MKTFTIILLIILVIPFSCSPDYVSTLQKQAEDALKRRDYSAAISYFEKSLSLDPQNQELNYFLGQAYLLLLYAKGNQINHVDPFIAGQSSKYFRKAIEISPKYEGRKFIFGPRSKIQGIWSAVAMTYLSAGKTDSALYAFKKGQSEGGFYPALLEYNQNTMASCDNNAILFTYGDNDTFPMWYLQFIEGYRKDITIVNLSLLNMPWYIKQLMNKYPFGNNNILMNLTDEKMDHLKNMKWDESVVTIPVNNDSKNIEGNVQWRLTPTTSNNHLRVQDLVLLEILKANNWMRPIYFSSTVPKLNFLGLNDYLSFEGLVYRLKSHKEDSSVAQLENNCLDVYTYNGIHDEKLQQIEELQILFQNYRAGFNRLASFSSSAGRNDKANEILKFMNSKLPERLLPYPEASVKKVSKKDMWKIGLKKFREEKGVNWSDDFNEKNKRWEWDYNSGTGYKYLNSDFEGNTVLAAGISKLSDSLSYSDCSLYTYLKPDDEVTVEARMKFSDNNGFGDAGRGSRGFGFWDGAGHNVAWFFGLSPESLSEGQGFKAVVRNDGEKPLIKNIQIDLRDWHIYRIDLLNNRTRFLIDDIKIAEFAQRPRNLNKLSIWLDNYGVKSDTTRFYLGLKTDQKIWVDWVKFRTK